MPIVLVTGSMFSGKTTFLLANARKYRLAKKKVVLIKYAGDTRSGNADIYSHDQTYSTSAFSTDTLKTLLTEELIETCDVVLIDEGQFFSDLAEITHIWAKQGKHIIISALNGTFERKPFPAISELIPYINSIIHLSAVCTLCGADAHFSHLKNAGISDDHGFIIGGSEQYEARCRLCLPS